MDALDWVERALHEFGIRLVEISPRIAIQSSRIPGLIHADSVDRLIVASAFEENSVLITIDQKLIEFGKSGPFISVHNPCKLN